MAINKLRMEDALNSMLRTDYIPLGDTQKLGLLKQYYVDYLGYLDQLLSESDQLVVGRRGTGETTLFYRALVECMHSWAKNGNCSAKPRTLGIYLDLSKCQLLSEGQSANYDDFEHIFISELCDTISEELTRSWPELRKQSNLF